MHYSFKWACFCLKKKETERGVLFNVSVSKKPDRRGFAVTEGFCSPFRYGFELNLAPKCCRLNYFKFEMAFDCACVGFGLLCKLPRKKQRLFISVLVCEC